ncbi:coproporphyrinogen dehydrogenase HemZ [Anaerostipes sp.]|uniref:coproporphyrinogen dehydrogenase HemZ n=1 Tax=Anaerostipes sp. TaxID=1872530 RepID=UPI002587FC32|nr:coproporphyrinogen dehydrogenase HemZ [Anaerostipes sp.]MCI5622779.1 coproporphyrinogen dehydrogenase HemZ [Anaerostipes sp.]
MIGLIQNETIYEYDLRSLILAFMLGEKIELTDSVDSIYDFILRVSYQTDVTHLTLYKKGIKVSRELIPGDYKDKKSFKNRIKRGVYLLLSEELKRELPWGTLTGIRPTKIVFDGFEQGKSRKQIIENFQTEYLASQEKASLCTEVAAKERKLLETFPYKDGYSLYVGIPFCPSTCLYCSFTSYPVKTFQSRVNGYLEALLKEAAFVKERYKWKKLQTMYIGGGTPTSLSASELDYLLDRLNKYFPFSELLELTVEAGRPDSITKEKLQVLKRYGVTRISINPQTMNDKTLKLIGRNHSVKDVKEKFHLAREVGFHNINMDIICGLPEEGIEELETTCQEIKKLDPESLTVHSLAVKRTSKLNHMRDEYHFGATEEMVSFANHCAGEMNMSPYYMYRQKNIPGNLENVGFSKKSKECLYNILIMEELHDIIAIGAGTSSKIINQKLNSISRIENLKDVIRYTARIDEMIHRKEEKMNLRQEL